MQNKKGLLGSGACASSVHKESYTSVWSTMAGYLNTTFVTEFKL